MTTDELHYLVTIARHRNIGRAAEALGLTQPALTRAVARLEAVAGQRLFARHPRGVEPTDAGQVFVQRAQQMLAAYEDALRELHQMKAGQLGLLRVGCSPSVDKDLLVAATRRLVLERPATQLLLMERLTTELLRLLEQGELDLVVGPLQGALSSALTATPLHISRLNVVSCASHALQRQGVLSLAQVQAEPWLLSAAPGPLRREIDELLARAGLPPLNVRIEADSLSHLQFQLLRGTRLLGICSDGTLRAVCEMGLRPLEVRGLDLRRQMAVVRRRGAFVPPLADRLTALLREEVLQLDRAVSPAA
jgi:DNA-binding transcriptional LysR family regulator